MKVSKKLFDQWVVQAIDMVPKRLIKKMHNLVFVVDDRPTRAQIKQCQLRRGYTLFGLYQGYEQTGKRAKMASPDKISIFRNAFLGKYKYLKRMRDQVYKTVWHEISHHFGSNEEGAIRAEKRMFEIYISQRNAGRVLKREMKKKTKVKKGRRGYKRKSKVTFRVK